MSTTGPSRGPVGVATSAHDVLHEAVRRLERRIEEVYPPLEPGGSSRAEGYLATLAAKVLEVIEGADPVRAREWLASSPLFAPLMDALIDEVLNVPANDAEAGSALVVLRALMSLRSHAETSSSGARASPGSDNLRASMAGAGAFELLVEVAHDFRSPLTSILFLAEALRDGHSGPVTEVQRSQLGLVYSAAFGLASIASDVMDLARREKDLIDDEAQPFSPAEVFRSVERMVRPIVEEKGLELRVVVPERWQLVGHPHALSRVLLNLTTNALKFTDEGSVEIGVKPVPHGRVEYYVQDTGRGISADEQQRLFQPFRRRSEREQEGHYFSGSGIGLSIARRLLRAMGSDVNLDATGERGTRFSFVLPDRPRSAR